MGGQAVIRLHSFKVHKFDLSHIMPSQYGAPMKYPYGFMGKMLHFPYRTYFNSTIYRYWVYALILTAPLANKVHNVLNSPANVEMWRVKREHHKVDHFARPSLD